VNEYDVTKKRSRWLMIEKIFLKKHIFVLSCFALTFMDVTEDVFQQKRSPLKLFFSRKISSMFVISFVIKHFNVSMSLMYKSISLWNVASNTSIPVAQAAWQRELRFMILLYSFHLFDCWNNWNKGQYRWYRYRYCAHHVY